MGRARHQRGYVLLTASNHWQGHWYIYSTDPATGQERRAHRSQLLGSKSQMRKFEAEEKLRQLIAASSSPAAAAKASAADLSFRQFMEQVYMPMRGDNWRPATRASNLYYLEKHIYPALGAARLPDVSKFAVQTLLNRLAASGYSYTVLYHVRDLIKAALAEAVEQEVLNRNPARKTAIPEVEERQKHVLPASAYPQLLAGLATARDQAIFMVASFCALRSSELFGLTMACDHGADFLVMHTAYRGQLQLNKTKKRGKKGHTNSRLVAIPAAVRPYLDRWLAVAPDTAPEAMLFPGRGGKPMHGGNWLRLYLHPLEAALGLDFHVSFQILRRSFATHGQNHSQPKAMQQHLGHSALATTMDIYTQPLDPEVRAMADRVTEKLLGLTPLTERTQ